MSDKPNKPVKPDPKKKPKRPRDANQLAKFIVDLVTKPTAPAPTPPKRK